MVCIPVAAAEMGERCKKCLYWISCFSARGKSTCFSGNNTLYFVRRPLDETKNKSFVWIQRPLNKDAVGMQSVSHKGRLRGRQRENHPALRVRWSEGEEPIPGTTGLKAERNRHCGRSRRERAAWPRIQIMQLIITPSIRHLPIYPSSIHQRFPCSQELLEAGLSQGHTQRDGHPSTLTFTPTDSWERQTGAAAVHYFLGFDLMIRQLVHYFGTS